MNPDVVKSINQKLQQEHEQYNKKQNEEIKTFADEEKTKRNLIMDIMGFFRDLPMYVEFEVELIRNNFKDTGDMIDYYDNLPFDIKHIGFDKILIVNYPDYVSIKNEHGWNIIMWHLVAVHTLHENLKWIESQIVKKYI